MMRLRIITALLGALPASLLLPFVALLGLKAVSDTLKAVLEAELTGALADSLYIAWSVLGIWGVYSLWASALGPLPVKRSTALGLSGGIIAMATLLLTTGSLHIASLTALWLLVGPVFIAGWQLWLYGVNRRGEPPGQPGEV